MAKGAAAPVETLPADAAFTPPATLYRDHRDARAYVHATLALVLLLYASLGLALAGLLPAWALAIAVPLVYLRLALALHELLHVRSADAVPFFHRLTMVFETPLCLGYREHRAVHFAHHRFASTERDPERYQIVGGPVRAFANALVSPERGFVHWVRTHGVSRTLAVEGGLRLAGFVAVASINPRVFLVYWVALRVSVGIAAFVFHHVLHNDHGRLGTFRPAVSRGVIRASGWLFGTEPMLIVTEHERHHAWPRVRARDLPLLPEPRA
jgi:hypothetical protein